MDEKEKLVNDNVINPDDINLDVDTPAVEQPQEQEESAEQAATEQTEGQVEPTTAPLEQPTEVTHALEDEILLPAEAVSLHQEPEHKKSGHKKTIIVIILIVLFALIGGAVAWMVLNKDDSQTTQEPQKSTVVLMGAELTIIDGIAQTSTDNKTWANAKAGDQIAQGVYVKTAPEGRAVISLDDGSAIRVNSNSIVKIDSLNTTNVVIINESGQVYTRVVPSERQFSVLVEDEAFGAMGTAYVTINTEETQGVEVYESAVKVASNEQSVPEGKYYYVMSKNAGDKQQVVSDIPVDKVKQDAFLAWNYQQDKNNSEFNKKLGYLTKIDEVTAPSTPATPPTPANASITLSGTAYDSGVKLKWSIANTTAPQGFKIVKSKSANPTFGKDDAQYVSDPNARSYAWGLKDGNTYHFRVCIYTGNSCSTYSNDITVTTPKVQQTSVAPAGSLTLTSKGGAKFAWTLNSGEAPQGYKLVWSKSDNPVYPGNDYEYYSSPDTTTGAIFPDMSGTYKVRVCIYTGGGCKDYSNQVQTYVEVPIPQ